MSAAVKRATKLYYEEAKKGEDSKSAKKISEEIKKQFDGVGPSAHTITRYVNEYSLVDSSPLKRGNPGLLPTWAFESLCVALESYFSINQINMNCSSNQKKNLSARVNGCASREDARNNKLINHILWQKSIDLEAAKLQMQKA